MERVMRQQLIRQTGIAPHNEGLPRLAIHADKIGLARCEYQFCPQLQFQCIFSTSKHVFAFECVCLGIFPDFAVIYGIIVEQPDEPVACCFVSQTKVKARFYLPLPRHCD